MPDPDSEGSSKTRHDSRSLTLDLHQSVFMAVAVLVPVLVALLNALFG